MWYCGPVPPSNLSDPYALLIHPMPELFTAVIIHNPTSLSTTGLQTKINQLQTESNTYQKARQNAEVRAQQLQIELNTIHNKIGTELVTRLVYCHHGNIMYSWGLGDLDRLVTPKLISIANYNACLIPV